MPPSTFQYSKLIGKNVFTTLLLCLVICFTSFVSTHAQQASSQGITLEFNEADIRSFIRYIGESTGKNIVIDPSVKGRVTVISPRPIPADEAFKTFESVLEVHGFMAVQSGNVIKILPAKSARTQATSMGNSSKQPIVADDGVITQIFHLKRASVQEVEKTLSPFISSNGLLTGYGPSGTLIITETRNNIRRLIQILKVLDGKSQQEVVAFPLIFANAKDVAAKLEKLFTRSKNSQKFLMLTADERTNLLLVSAPASIIPRIKKLITMLDKPASKGEGNIRVFKLINANAESIGKILSELIGNTVGKEGDRLQTAIENGAKIVADSASNSLIVTAAPNDFPTIAHIIRQLDVRRKQVLVEALIMEVAADKSFDLGINWQAGTATSTSSAVGILEFELDIPNVNDTSISALIKAARKDSDINIISTPQIMTLDNEEAFVSVGENRPFLVSSDSGETTTSRTNQKFEYKDVGTELRITPQISEDGFVRLKINQTFSEVTDATTVGATQPVTRKRTTETAVLVKDGHTVVISGLISSSSTLTEEGVPGLSEIPVLGWLFKSQGNTRKKTNLMVFITPHVVNTAKDAQKLAMKKRRMHERLQFQDDGRIAPRVDTMWFVLPTPPEDAS